MQLTIHKHGLQMSQISILLLFLSFSTMSPTELDKTEKPTGYIEGVISNEHNHPIPNALIYLKKDSELIKVATSDSIGLYKISSVKADTYSISVSYVGYFKKEIKNITIGKGKKEVDIKMKELRCKHGYTP